MRLVGARLRMTIAYFRTAGKQKFNGLTSGTIPAASRLAGIRIERSL